MDELQANEQKCACGCKCKGHMILGVFALIVFVCLAVFLIGEARNAFKKYDYIGKSAETPNTISVSGEGLVTATSDIAKVDIGTSTDAQTVAEAQVKNSAIMNSVIGAIKRLGVDEKDIKTKNYNIYPKYDWQNGKNNVVGYTVTQSLGLVIRDTKKTSDILKAAGESGANQIGSLSFEIDGPEKLKAEARTKAIQNAKEKAEALVDSLGVKLGRVIAFSESSGGGIIYEGFGLSKGVDSMSAPAPEIQTGENEIRSNVTVLYEIL